jgi:hypothetical protein
VLAVIAGVAIALLSAGEPRVQPVRESDVPRQVDEIKQFLREHSR